MLPCTNVLKDFAKLNCKKGGALPDSGLLNNLGDIYWSRLRILEVSFLCRSKRAILAEDRVGIERAADLLPNHDGLRTGQNSKVPSGNFSLGIKTA